MSRVFSLIIFVAALTGCAATKTTSHLYSEPSHDQYCHTKQSITVQNGETVSSTTNLNCSDDKLDKVVMNKAGMASSCEYYGNKFYIGGKLVRKVGIRCQTDNGDWHIVDDDIHN
jgi:hypothetical protein